MQINIQKIERKVRAKLPNAGEDFIKSCTDLKVGIIRRRTVGHALLENQYQAHMKAKHNYPGAKPCDGSCIH
jgi:hypothetical protein